MQSREDFKSFIPAKRKIPELTVRAVIVGALLAIILGAANAYFGLYAGMTVSAAIPGAVMAFAFLRPFKGTILEVNVGMMGASRRNSTCCRRNIYYSSSCYPWDMD
jgi:uncharacterized oligopeptide transporter (OPT) family protein